MAQQLWTPLGEPVITVTFRVLKIPLDKQSLHVYWVMDPSGMSGL